MAIDNKYAAGQEVSAEITEMIFDMLKAEGDDGFVGYVPFEEFSRERIDVYPGQTMDLFVVFYDEEINSALLSLDENPAFLDAERSDEEDGRLQITKDIELLGDLYMAAGKTEKAEEKYKEALSARIGLDNGDDAEVKWNISQTYKKLGDLALEAGANDKAEDFYLKGVGVIDEFDMNCIEYNLHLRLGNLYEEMGEKDKAVDYLEQAAGRLVNRAQSILARGENPDTVHTETTADVFYRLGHLYLEDGNKEEALRYFSFAETVFDDIARGRGTFRDHYRLAELYWLIGDLEEDEEMLEQADQLLIQLVFNAPELKEIRDLLEKVRNKLGREMPALD